jgi:thiol-disulfide isomerase/thioredoxin
MLRGIILLCLLSGPLLAAEPWTLEIGASAPDFSLPGVDDKTYTLADFADKDILAIVFTCNHCPTAQAYEGRIKALAEKYRDQSVAIVAVSPNAAEAVRLDELGFSDLGDSLEDMKIRAREQEFDFPYLYDGETQSMAQAYGPVATPHVFIFDKARKLRFCGRIDDGENPKNIKHKDTENALDALLAGKPVSVETTRTFGCSIKWADKIPSAEEALAKWNEETAELEEIDVEGIKKLVKNDTENLRVINVWATWCGPCVAEFPELVEIHRMYRNREFEFITITADPPERREQALAFLNKNHASMKNYIFNEDDPYKLADALGFEWKGALPYTAVIAPGGKVVFGKMEPVDPFELKKAIVEQISRYYFKMEEEK